MRCKAQWWLCGMALLLLLGAVGSGARGDEMPGDVTGDNVVDLKDALRLFQIAQGILAPTDRDRRLGDVFPVVGSGERPFGDGQLTREDAHQILRMMVGLVPVGEVTGQFEPPQIDDFTPRSGAVGTKVTIVGKNLPSGAQLKRDVVVLFGEVPASVVTPKSAAELETVVPVGFRRGPITVLTPGGEARSLGEFLVQESATGKLELPPQFKPENTDVVSVVDKGNVDAQGNFSVSTLAEWATLVTAVPKHKPNSVFFKFILPEPKRQGESVINAHSTAEALILLQPLFATPDTDLLAQFMANIRGLPEFEQLAQVVGQVWVESAKPLDDPRYEAALEAALEAAAKVYPGAAPAAPTQSKMQTSSPSQQERYFFNVDAKFLDLRFSREFLNRLDVNPLFGSPVDWFVRVARLDPKGLPDRLSELKAERVYPRLDYTDATILSASRVFNVTEILGFSQILRDFLPKKLVLEPDAMNAVYVVRAFSGVVRDTSPNGVDTATIINLPLGTEDAMSAYVDNALQALVETTFTFLPIPAIPGTGGMISFQSVVQIAIQKLIVALREGLPKVIQEIKLEFDPLRRFDKIYAFMVAMGKQFVKILKDEAVVAGLSANLLLTLLAMEEAWKALPVAGKIVKLLISLPPLVERLAGMAGYQLAGLLVNVLKLTPLETSFVIIGNPFGVVVDDFTPDKGFPRSRVTITGRGFDPTPANNDVRFAEVQAKVLEVRNDVHLPGIGIGDEMVVEAPLGAGWGPVPISVQAKGTRSKTAEKKFNMGRVPVITDLTPESGYPPGAFQGQPREGTQVTISGKFFAYKSS